MDKRSFIATLCVCGTVVTSAVLFSNAGAPTPVVPPDAPVIQAGGPLCPCPGDANCDGVVNFADITAVLANWNRICCPPGAACDDGDPCTIGDTCIAGQGCVGIPVVCDDFNPCTQDICCQGICIHIPIPDCCMIDAQCDDGNICTQDLCNPTTNTCSHIPIPGCGTCQTHADCNDNNACTIDQCLGGLCQYIPLACNDNNPCTTDACDPVVGCVYTTIPGCGPCTNNSECDDGNPCTNDYCDPMSLLCAHTPIPGCGPCQAAVDCDDGLPCTNDTCVMGVCQHIPAPDGTVCNDGNPCTVGDVCVNGQCQPGAPINCNDNNPCTQDACDPMNGQCIHTPLPNGSGCDDSNPCTVEDTCVNGVCQGIPINCDDGNPCTQDSCQGGMCFHTPMPNGSPCSDGNACTLGDACSNGVCIPGSPVQCPPGSFCNPATGGCEVPNP